MSLRSPSDGRVAVTRNEVAIVLFAASVVYQPVVVSRSYDGRSASKRQHYEGCADGENDGGEDPNQCGESVCAGLQKNVGAVAVDEVVANGRRSSPGS